MTSALGSCGLRMGKAYRFGKTILGLSSDTAMYLLRFRALIDMMFNPIVAPATPPAKKASSRCSAL